MRLRSIVTAAALCVAAPALAQTGSGDFRNALGTNFIAIPFGVFSVDYEHAVGSSGMSVGFGALTGTDDGQRISWGHAKVKYYPAENSLRGLALGLTAGMVSERDRFTDCIGIGQPGGVCTDAVRTESAPTIGVVVDYNWLLGRRNRFLFGIGVGARRVLKDVEDCSNGCPPGTVISPLEQVYPDGRFTLGFAF
jgi:hypothetical protein